MNDDDRRRAEVERVLAEARTRTERTDEIIEELLDGEYQE